MTILIYDKTLISQIKRKLLSKLQLFTIYIYIYMDYIIDMLYQLEKTAVLISNEIYKLN